MTGHQSGDGPAGWDHLLERWDDDSREIESWLDDRQLLADLGGRCALAMLACHPDLGQGDRLTPVMLRALLAADWLQDDEKINQS